MNHQCQYFKICQTGWITGLYISHLPTDVRAIFLQQLIDENCTPWTEQNTLSKGKIPSGTNWTNKRWYDSQGDGWDIDAIKLLV